MEKKPLIHCITNYVAMDFTANALLAVGATPIMSFCKEEMEEIVSQCDALSVNIGCLDKVQIESMELAVRAAASLGKPWVLDPVGYGLTRLRTDTCNRLIEMSAPAIIRGNSRELGDKNACRRLARKTGSVVVMSGERDFITDSTHEIEVGGGDVKQALVTGMGCTCSAVCAALLAMCGDPLTAARATMRLFAFAGEKAAEDCKGLGEYKTRFMDILYEKSRTGSLFGD
ncbi:MAG: hydroxyethylthiazole kinase [Bacteroidaceae bacterium]|nr:hydroxyethylthiazole kinase [Bacteroidaceae bacterium]